MCGRPGRLVKQAGSGAQSSHWGRLSLGAQVQLMAGDQRSGPGLAGLFTRSHHLVLVFIRLCIQALDGCGLGVGASNVKFSKVWIGLIHVLEYEILPSTKRAWQKPAPFSNALDKHSYGRPQRPLPRLIATCTCKTRGYIDFETIHNVVLQYKETSSKG